MIKLSWTYADACWATVFELFFDETLFTLTPVRFVYKEVLLRNKRAWTITWRDFWVKPNLYSAPHLHRHSASKLKFQGYIYVHQFYTNPWQWLYLKADSYVESVVFDLPVYVLNCSRPWTGTHFFLGPCRGRPKKNLRNGQKYPDYGTQVFRQLWSLPFLSQPNFFGHISMTTQYSRFRRHVRWKVFRRSLNCS